MSDQAIVVRPATAADADALARFNADVHREQDADLPNPQMAVWTRDLTNGRHPTTAVEDFVVAIDPATQGIVAAMGLVAQTWQFDGIPIPMGQPELVGTLPAYRGRGLVRRLFVETHARSAAQGHLLQAIDGVPWFYRQFGYEMALALRAGQSIDATSVPRTPPKLARLRAARVDDAAFLARSDAAQAGDPTITCVRDERLWRYELTGHDAACIFRPEVRIVESPDGQAVGYVAHTPRVVGGGLWVVGWAGVAPDIGAVLAALRSTGERYAARGDPGGFTRIGVWLGETHPSYAALPHSRAEPAYAWSIRIPDLAALLRHVAPILAARLAGSAHAHFTGTLRLNFFTDGLALRFADGHLVDAAPWRQPLDLHGIERFEPTTADRADAALPERIITQLVCGHRSLDELAHAFPDCLVRTDAIGDLLRTLFPKRTSNVWAVM